MDTYLGILRGLFLLKPMATLEHMDQYGERFVGIGPQEFFWLTTVTPKSG